MRGGGDSFSGSEQVFDQLAQWVAGRLNFSETATFQCAEDSNDHAVYCYEMAHNAVTGNYVLVLWNETITGSSKIAGIRATDPVGGAPLEVANVEDGVIPGVPTYFWISPSNNFVATIRTEGSFSGTAGMSKYIHSFMKHFSPARRKISVGNKERVQYFDSNVGELRPGYRPRFKMHRKLKDITRAMFLGTRPKVVKVIYRDCLRRQYAVTEDLWQKFMRFAGVGDPNSLPRDLEFKTELKYCPSESEFAAMVDHVLSVENQEGELGVVYKGGSQTYWLSKIIDRREINVNIETRGGAVTVYTAGSLLRACEIALGSDTR